MLRFVIYIVVLCSSTADLARVTIRLWKRTELRGQLQLPLFAALSAVSIILAALLLHYSRDDTAVTILLVSFLDVAGIIQV